MNPYASMKTDEPIIMKKKKKKKGCCGHKKKLKNPRPNPPSEDTVKTIIRKDNVLELFRDLAVSREESLFNSNDSTGFVKQKFALKMA